MEEAICCLMLNGGHHLFRIVPDGVLLKELDTNACEVNMQMVTILHLFAVLCQLFIGRQQEFMDRKDW